MDSGASPDNTGGKQALHPPQSLFYAATEVGRGTPGTEINAGPILMFTYRKD
jgi:hypothetical protein